MNFPVKRSSSCPRNFPEVSEIRKFYFFPQKSLKVLMTSLFLETRENDLRYDFFMILTLVAILFQHYCAVDFLLLCGLW